MSSQKVTKILDINLNRRCAFLLKQKFGLTPYLVGGGDSLERATLLLLDWNAGGF